MTKRKADPVEHQSANPLDERIEQLKQLFPEVVNIDGIDFDTLRNLLDIEFPQKERFVFGWAGKQEAILSLQKASKNALKPVPEESINWDGTSHLFIEGDNLEVLKLLYKAYFGQVKMIYIDPPYNTGRDFIYSDDFSTSLATYLRATGQVDEDGKLQSSDTDTNGKKHSNWLSMMYPRLFLARQLLREDGVIFISIDDNEVAHLRLLCDSIFGSENFVDTVIWQKVFSPKNSARHFSQDHDYILVYAKNAELWRPNLLPRTEEADARYSNPDQDPRGPWSSSDLTARNYYGEGRYEVVSPSGKTYNPGVGRYWRQSHENFKILDGDNRIWWGEDGGNMPRLKRFLIEVQQGIVPQTIWKYKEVGHTQEAKRTLIKYVRFDNPENVLNSVKPPRLIERMLQLATNANQQDIVLDFFAGSATTGHAVLNQNRADGGNRRFICVQFPEPLPVPEENFSTIADIGKQRLRNVIAEYKTENGKKLEGVQAPLQEDLGFRLFKLDKSPMRQWEELLADQTSPEEYARQMELFVIDPLLDGWTEQDVIAEVAIKEAGFGLTYRVEKVEAVANQSVYRVVDDEKDQHFYICLDDKISLDALKPLTLTRNDLFIFRDSAITDTIAANLALTCRIKSI